LVAKPEEKRPRGKTRFRWEINIRLNVREVGWEGVDWINLAQDRNHRWGLLKTLINLQVP
jgi:hypothetical protein